MNLLSMADENCCIPLIDVRAVGRESVSSVFGKSSFAGKNISIPL
jgi:hypothetical protein